MFQNFRDILIVHEILDLLLKQHFHSWLLNPGWKSFTSTVPDEIDVPKMGWVFMKDNLISNNMGW